MTKKGRNTRKITDYLIVIMALIAVNPFFSTLVNFYLFFFLIVIFLIALRRGKNILNQKIIGILLGVYFLLLIQGIFYKGFSMATLYTPLILFYLPYLVIKVSDLNFLRNYLKVLYVICLYTTPLWLLQSTIPAVDSFFQIAINWAYQIGWGSSPRSLLFFTAGWGDAVYNSNLGIYRNSGLFHEPGAYAVFLVLGIILNSFMTGKNFDKKNIVFIFCLLTTLSTAGYISLFFILIAFLWKQRIHLLFKLIILALFLGVSVRTYQNEEFLQSKIQEQYDDQKSAAEENLGREKGKSGRFFAFFTSYELFLQNPIFGRGIIFATSAKATGEMHVDSSYTYGFMGMLATYGLLFATFFLYFFYKGFKLLGRISNKPSYFIILVFIAINLALSTQIFITTTFFVSIFMIGVNYKLSYTSPQPVIAPLKKVEIE